MRKADSLPPSCAVVMKSGNLNFLEPSGPLQTSNGAALPFYSKGKCSVAVFSKLGSRPTAGLRGVLHWFAAAVLSVLHIRFIILDSSDFQLRKRSLCNSRQTANQLLQGNYRNPLSREGISPCAT